MSGITLERAQELAEEAVAEVCARYDFVLPSVSVEEGPFPDQAIVVRLTMKGGGKWLFAIYRKTLEQANCGEEMMLSMGLRDKLIDLAEDGMPPEVLEKLRESWGD